MAKLKKKGIMLFEKDLKQDGHSLTQSLGCDPNNHHQNHYHHHNNLIISLFKSQGIKLSNVYLGAYKSN